MKLNSSAFENLAQIGAAYTVDGADQSPPLAWNGVPDGTRSLALICEDPDAPSPKHPGPEPWIHWVIYNIPAELPGLPSGISRTHESDKIPGAKQGINSWSNDNVGYRGPAPPPRSGPHRYFFKLYALDRCLDMKAGATKKQLLDAMASYILAEAQLIGIYERR
jgi:Raf kinase inhibitor-like YbhB/YbcL family protein